MKKSDTYKGYLFILLIILFLFNMDLSGLLAEHLLAIATFLLALITAISVFLTHYPKPKLKIEFKQEEAFCRFSYTPYELTKEFIKELKKKDIQFDPKNKYVAIPGYWVRIKVKNIGRRSAHRCVGKLIEIRNENCSVRTDFDIAMLHWVGHFEIDNYHRIFYRGNQRFSISKSNKFEPIDLGLKDYQYLDVLWTEMRHHKFHINCPRVPDRGIKFDYEPGIYYLRIIVTSDNADSAEIILKIQWNGNWNEIRISEQKCREPITEEQTDPKTYNLVNMTRITP